jgi:transcriptional regulator with XRE-family HTH domain
MNTITNHETESTLQKTVADDMPRRQTAPRRTRQKVVPVEQRKATPDAEPRDKPPYTGRPEYRAFAETLYAAMEAAGMTKSELAAQIWGRTKDARGYDVAKGRDRVGHYLNGTSYPEPANLELIAKALAIPGESLTVERPTGSPAPRTRSASTTLQLLTVADQPDKMRLQVDQVIDWVLAMHIGQLIKLAEAGQRITIPDIMPGTVINGDKNDNGTEAA